MDYTFSTPTFTNQGHVSVMKMDDMRIQTNIMGMPLHVSIVTTNIHSIPFWINLGDHFVEGSLSNEGASYQLQATYGKDKATVTDITWDKKNCLTLRKFSTHIGQHTLKLETASTFDLATMHFTKDLQFKCDDVRITLQKLGFSPTLSGQISLHQSNLDLLKKDFPTLDMSGNITINARMDGTFDNPHITASLISDGLKHRTLSALRIVKTHVKAVYKNHTLNFDSLIDGKHDLSIKVTGTATQENLSIKTDIKGTLRHIKKILPTEDHIDGTFKGSFITTGNPLSPQTSGDLTFMKGVYENFIIGTHIKNLNGKATLKENHVQIHLQGSDDFKGILKGQGNIKIPTFSGDIHLDLHEFYLGQSDLFTGKADGTLSINLDKKSITGELRLDPVIVDIDQLTPSATPKIHFIEGKVDVAEIHDGISAVESPFSFSIDLIPKNKVIVRGFGIESTWKGSMAIQGKHPNFVGKFLLDKGTIDITGRILNFTKGIITFDHKINEPYLDLEITKKIDSYDVYVQLQGRPLDSKFTFLSSPALTQEEVLALILLGRKSAAASLGQLFDISASLSSLSSAGQDKSFFTTFRKVFGIEALEIKKQDQTSASEAPQAISIRKQIATDFSVVIEQTLNATEDENKRSKAIIEKQINDNWNVECDVSTDKSGSIGLNWVKRY
ncbi:MAG: translocation/assembly module TamB [Alphaproteobacteria bacterium]|nr:translocation/assembly module TamB [Alphaproteobacteria bacterium]